MRREFNTEDDAAGVLRINGYQATDVPGVLIKDGRRVRIERDGRTGKYFVNSYK